MSKRPTTENAAPLSLRCRLGIHRRWDSYGAGGVEPARIWIGYCVRCGKGVDLPDEKGQAETVEDRPETPDEKFRRIVSYRTHAIPPDPGGGAA